MSAACLRICLSLFIVVCIFISSTSCSKENSVVWRKTGEQVTIECKPKDAEVGSITLSKGINREVDIFYKTNTSATPTVLNKNRTQVKDDFPTVAILLMNLTPEDTGVYWCLYRKIIPSLNSVDGEGSVLLVVTDPLVATDKSTGTPPQCDNQPNSDLVVISVVISSAVLLIIIMTFLLLAIQKLKSSHAEVKPRPIPNNDVYEDMRGTIRR